MAKKKAVKTKNKRAAVTKTARKPAPRHAAKVIGKTAKTGSRRCSECNKLGHNQRSHRPGGRLANAHA